MDKRTYLYTSTPKKGKLKCEECSDESQCTNCFVDEYIKNRHEHHNTNIEKSSTFFGPKTDYSESLIKRTWEKFGHEDLAIGQAGPLLGTKCFSTKQADRSYNCLFVCENLNIYINNDHICCLSFRAAHEPKYNTVNMWAFLSSSLFSKVFQKSQPLALSVVMNFKLCMDFIRLIKIIGIKS